MSPLRNISLYIPRVFINFFKCDIAMIFESLSIGKVKNIDLVLKMGKDGKEYNSAYIHFEYWYDNVAAINFQDRVLDPNQEARLIYDEPWYWIVLENKAKKFIPGEKKARINLGDLNEKNEKLNIMCESKDFVIEEEKNYDACIKNHPYVKYLERLYFDSLINIGDIRAQIEQLKYEQAQFNLPV